MIDKNNKYLIAIDIDYTLKNDRGEITPKNKKAINKVVNKGNVVVICSGRPYTHALNIANEISSSDYLISYNGALVYDVKNNFEIFSSKLNKQKIKDFINLCFTCDIKCVLSKDDIDYVTKLPSHEKQVLMSKDKLFDLIDTVDFYQCLVIDKDIDKIKTIYNDVVSKKNFNIGNQSCFTGKSQYYWFCINNVNSSKGKALKILACYLKMNKSQIISIGNDDNDVSMFKESQYAVVMANASNEVKKYADIITKDNNSSGVAAFLEKLI